MAGSLCVLPWAVAAAYLPAIGPAPLRLQPPPAPSVVAAVAPVLTEERPAAADTPASDPVSAPATNAVPVADPVVTTAKSPSDFLPADSTNALPTFSVPADPSLITPQMMMQFFQRQTAPTNATNATDAGVLLPFVFTPPVPVA